MAVTKALRFEILRRDKFTCTYCGATSAESALHVDHVIPSSLGGEDTPDNLTTACIDCNAGKSSRMVDDQPVAPADERSRRWAQAMAQAAEETRQESDDRRAYALRWRDDWESWPGAEPLPVDWESTILRFLDHGLSARDVHELIEPAMLSAAKSEWRYFCGCCWTRLRQYRERAYEILKDTQ